MSFRTAPRWLAIPVLCLGAAGVFAQQPGSLIQVLPPPAGAAQESAALGMSVAMNATYTVAGAPFDDLGGQDSGVVKVFDTATGDLLHVLVNPSPNTGDQFGHAVAISGSRVVVGAFQDDTSASNAGRAYVYDLGGSNPTVPVLELSQPAPVAADQFGYSVAISGNRVAVSANLDDTGATNTGRVFIYNLAGANPQTPSLIIPNPTPVSSDLFGQSIALDGGWLVVGVPQKDLGGTSNVGSVELFNLDSATPATPVASLLNPHPAANDTFGNAVSVSGTRFVAGTSLDDATGVNSGRAYVYDFGSGAPSGPAYVLDNPGPAVADQFGHSVAIHGSRVVVGTPYDDTAANNSGRAYVFDLAGADPQTAVAALAKTTPVSADNLSLSVAIHGSLVAAGVPFDDQQILNVGSVAIFDLNGPTPGSPVRFLRHGSPSSGDLFGGAVAISGTRMVVGASLDDTGALNAGSAHVFDLASPAPGFPVLSLANPEPSFGAEFGYAVAVSGTWVAVSAPFSDTPQVSDVGRVYVYNLAGATPAVPAIVVNNPEPATSDQFGNALSLSGNLLVVGTRLDDAGAVNSGSVYVYDLGGASPANPLLTLRNPNPAAQDFFGQSVAVSQGRIVVGVPSADAGATDAGRAYVYDINSVTPTQPVLTLNNPAPAAGDQFGFSVSLFGDLAAVGANTDDAGASDAGSVYVYDLAGASPTAPAWTLANPQPAANDQFGVAVAVDGQRVAVGAHLDDLAADGAGTAWVYDLGSATPTTPELVLISNNPGVNDQFGSALAASGGRVLAGAARADLVTPDKGAAFVFGAELVQEAVDISLEHPPGTPLINGVASAGFGSTLVGGAPVSREFVIRNTGTEPLAGIAVTVTGSHAADFAVQQAPPAMLGAGEIATVEVRFTPAAGGARSAVLRVASNDPDENPFLVSLNGNGLVPTPDIAIEQPVGNNLNNGAAQVSFGQAATGGGFSDRVFTVRNTGTAELTGILLSMAGTNPSAYFVLAPPAAALAPGASTTFTLRFSPQTSGELTAVARVASNDPDENPFDVFLHGVGVVTPEISVEQPAGTSLVKGVSTIDFGTTAVAGQPLDRTFTVRNSGTGPLNSLEVGFAGAHPGDFTVLIPLPPSIPAGDSSTFMVRFAPLGGGARSATLSLASNDPDDNPFVVNLAGTGTVAPDLSIELPAGNPLYSSQSVVDFGNAALGGPAVEKVLTMRNAGTAPLTGVSVEISGDHAADFTVAQPPPATLQPGQVVSLTVRFQPMAADERTAYLAVASNDPDDNPFELELTGLSVPIPNLVVQQPAGQNLAPGATVDYGQVNAGMGPVEKVFKLRNTGTGTLFGISVQIDGADSADYAVATFPASILEPGTEAEFALRYTPVREKTSQARLLIESNDPDENPFEVQLRGTGISVPDIRIDQPAGNILVTGVSAVGFGTAAVGGTPVDKVFTLRNEGQADLSAVAVTFTGDHAADFTVHTAPPATLAAEGVATFVIRYAPTGGGQRSAALRVASNDPDENPFIIQLSGFATTSPDLAMEHPVGTALTHTVSTVNFGGLMLGEETTAERQFTLRNVGTGTLTSIAVSFFGGQAGDFSLVSPPPTILAPGETAAFTVRFSPKAGGNRQTSLHVASNDPTDNPFSVTLTGTGLVQPDITVEQPAGTSLTSGAAAVDFGEALPGGPPATRVFTLRNDGNGTLSGIATQISGAAAGMFTVTSAPAATLAPGQSTTMTLSFAPATPGAHAATLGIASNDPDENPFVIGLSGTGIIVPDIAVEQPAGTDLTSGLGVVTFGSALVRDGWQERTFTLRNTGTDTLRDVAVSFTGAAAADFSVISAPPATVEAGASAPFTLRFAPTAGGDRAATLRVASNDPDENPFTLSLTGFGVVIPDIVVEHPAGEPLVSGSAVIGFGTVMLGGPPASRVITLRNAGTGTLRITGTGISGSQAADFTISQPPPSSLAAGGAATLTVRFSPLANGARGATLLISSDDPDTGTFAIGLTGTGDALPDIALEHPAGQNLAHGSAAIGFGTVVLNAPPASRAVLLRNTGTAQLNGLSASLSGSHPADFSVISFSTTPLAPGSSAAFAVHFHPKAPGPRAATLVITSNDPDENPFEIALSGDGLAQPAIQVEHPEDEPLTPGSAELVFDPVQVASAAGELTFLLRNTGTAELNSLGAEFSGLHAGDFSLRDPLPASLAPGAVAEIALRFQPITIGARQATLTLTSNAANVNPFVITVSGSAQDYFTEVFSVARPNDTAGAFYTLRPATLLPVDPAPQLPPVEAPPAPVGGLDTPDAYAAATVLASREVPHPFIGGRVLVERLVDAAVKHPRLRVEDEYEVSGTKRRRVAQRAMVADHILVKPKPGVQPATLLAGMGIPDSALRAQLPVSGLWLVSFPAPDLDRLPQAIDAAVASGHVTLAEADFAVTAAALPNDSGFPGQWHLNNTGQSGGTPGIDIRAPAAWDTRTSAASVRVAVLDTGIDPTHPDLAANIWTNPNEIPGNGIDDDGNGYIDDVRGWNFVAGTPNASDDHSHGTHVAGVLGAAGNNGQGVAGTAWQAAMVPLKVLDAAGTGFTSDAAEALAYAGALDAGVICNAWSGSGFSQALQNLILEAAAAQRVVVSAAGNEGRDTDDEPVYPAAFDFENTLSVTAINDRGQLSWFANRGAYRTHLAAPGSGIYSTLPGGGYGFRDGTSAAAAQVAGVCALVKAAHPAWSAAQVKAAVLAGAEALPSLAGRTSCGGCLNAARALQASASLIVSPAQGLAATTHDAGASREFLLHNLSASPLSFTASASQPWVELSAASDTLAPGESRQVFATLLPEVASLPPGHHTATVTFAQTGSGISHIRAVAVRSAERYHASRLPLNVFPSDPAGGTPLALADDSFVEIPLPAAGIPFFGQTYSSVFVGSNGYITFGAGDWRPGGDAEHHFALPRLAAVSADLNPAAGGLVSWKPFSDHLAITFENVPEHGGAGLNSFQFQLFYNGRLSLTILSASAPASVIGLSEGRGLPDDFASSDFSGYPDTYQALAVFTADPVSRQVMALDPVQFEAAAVGASPLSYQWYRNGAPVPGATSPLLEISQATAAMAGTYQLAAVNVFGVAFSQPATLAVQKLPATVQLQNLAHTFNGFQFAPAVVTSPPGLAVSLTYNGAPTAPAMAGSYAVEALIDDATYQGTASATLVIEKAPQVIAFEVPAQRNITQPLALTASGGLSGLPVVFTLDSGPAVLDQDNVLTFTGTGEVSVTASQGGNINYADAVPVTRVLTVVKTPATVTLGNLAATYNGSAHAATATTNPPGLNVSILYDGSPVPPADAGTYTVTAAIEEAQYTGSASASLVIAKAAQNLQFQPIADQLATAVVGLSATGGASGNPVAFTVASGPAEISGTQLSFTGAGSVTVTASQEGSANYHAASVSRSFSVTKDSAAVTLSALQQVYDGTPRIAGAVTTPAGLPVGVTYDGSPEPPVNPGSYAVSAVVNDARYQGSASGTLVVDKVTAAVTLVGLAQTYDGTPRVVTAITEPAGLPVLLTYDGSAQPPLDAGSYAIAAVIDDPLHQGAASGTLTVAKAAQEILFPPIPDQLTAATYFLSAAGGSSGQPVTFTVTSGPAVISGSLLSFTASGQVTVTASQPGNANHLDAAPVSHSFHVAHSQGTVMLGDLFQAPDGAPKSVAVTTTPSGLNVRVTYNGSEAAPTEVGSYAVLAVIVDDSYIGSATGTLVLDHRADRPLIEPVEEQGPPAPAAQDIAWENTAAGRYDGLLSASAYGDAVSGEVENLVLAAPKAGAASGGALTAKLRLHGRSATLRGVFDLDGLCPIDLPQKDGSRITGSLRLQRTQEGHEVISGALDWHGEGALAWLPRSPFHARNRPAPAEWTGRFTLLLASPAGSGVDAPGGDGWAAVTIAPSGLVKVAGKLADGTALTESASLSALGEIALFKQLYRSLPLKGHVGGWLRFHDIPSVSDFHGRLHWLKHPDTRDRQYPAGFDTVRGTLGSRFTAPPAGTRLLAELADADPNASLNLFGPNLPPTSGQEIERVISWQRGNTLRHFGPETLTGAASSATGLVSGSYRDPATGLLLPFQGVVLQKQGLAAGFYLLGSGSGAMRVKPGTAFPYPGSEFAGPQRRAGKPLDPAAPAAASHLPFEPAAAGTYHGVVQDSTMNTGALENFKITSSGAFSGTLWIDGVRIAVAGAFDSGGRATLSLPLPNQAAPALLELELRRLDDTTDGFEIAGTIRVEDTPHAISAQRLPPHSLAARSPHEGAYTLAVLAPDSADPAAEPAGDGYAALRVSHLGLCTGALVLADGTKTTFAGHVARDGRWSLHRSLYGGAGRGYLAGALTFRHVAGSGDTDGAWTWRKLPNATPKSPHHATGFTTTRAVVGSRYQAPAAGASAWPELAAGWYNAWWRITESTGAPVQLADLDRAVTWHSTNRVQYFGIDTLKISVNAATGVVTGTYLDTARGVSLSFGGVLLPAQGLVTGHWVSPKALGRFSMEPR